MGNKTATKELANSIANGNADKLIYILNKYPELINQELDNTSRHTPLIRSIFCANYAITRILLADFQANINAIHGDSCALIAATITNNVDIIKLLVQFGVNLKVKIKESLTVMDFAILYGAYDAAYYLSRKYSMRISMDVDKYKRLFQLYSPSNTINYKQFLFILSQQMTPSQYYSIYPKKPISNKKNNQTVSYSSRIISSQIHTQKKSIVEQLCSTNDRTQVRQNRQLA